MGEDTLKLHRSAAAV